MHLNTLMNNLYTFIISKRAPNTQCIPIASSIVQLRGILSGIWNINVGVSTNLMYICIHCTKSHEVLERSARKMTLCKVFHFAYRFIFACNSSVFVHKFRKLLLHKSIRIVNVHGTWGRKSVRYQIQFNQLRIKQLYRWKREIAFGGFSCLRKVVQFVFLSIDDAVCMLQKDCGIKLNLFR